jgi:predicted transcriptional regulator
MSIAELKNSVIQKLEEVGEPVLKDVLELIKFETSTDVYKVNSLEKTSIELGLRQIVDGEILTHEQVNEETAEWLKE